ncbi:hypothetical protein M5689_013884 [Euphorbia peplus]|nr:hypothetical protein M5689_013884 [Euphorbia peplus]
MEAAAGGVASLGGGGRKEWRAVSDHHSVRSSVDEELGRSNLGHSDERTIYEVQHGREPGDIDFCSITVDGSLDNDILQQRIHSISRQREELQQMEIELKAQGIARSEIFEIRNNFSAQIKDREDAAANLQEKLCECQQTIHDLERRNEEKDRELHAIKLDNEAAWAKDDLLREQNKELATFRRERDHSEAERAQHIQQMRELQEHIQDKDRQILELQEQHRADQETIFLKEEQLKIWVARAQEMDSLHHSSQVELRERTEQYNQLWLGCQRQLAEMERLHLHTIQQLHIELVDARERSGSFPEESHRSQKSSKDSSKFGQSNGNQQDINGSGAANANNGALSNGNSENVSNQTNHVAGLPMGPSSMLGMHTYLPSGQVTALHPFILHQQGMPHSMPSHVPQSHAGHFHSIPTMSSPPQWQNQQGVSEGAQFSTQNGLPSSQTEKPLMREDAKYEYEISANGQGFHQNYLDVHIAEPESVISSSAGEVQALESMERSYLVSPRSEPSIQQMSSQLSDSLRLNHLEEKNDIKEQSVLNLGDQGLNDQVLFEEQLNSSAGASLSEASMHSVNLIEATVNNGPSVLLSEALIPPGQAGKTLETALLDERSLLACIVRTIPGGGGIRINSTLPNRLGKMLAPLHWHDYKKKYGKLDDFVAGHPELFLIEGDYIQLREGAQAKVAATAAVAKVAAAAAASSPYSSFLPSMAVTPMAQSHRIKKVPSIDSKHTNGVNNSATGGISNLKILSKSKDSQEPSGAEFDRSSVSSSQSSKGLINGRSNSNFTKKQQGRTSGATLTSGR